MFGKDAKKKELIKNLDNLYGQIQREHQISPGDFPDIKQMQERLQHQDFTKFKTLDTRFLNKVRKHKVHTLFVCLSGRLPRRKESGCPIRDSASCPGAGVGNTPYQACLG